MTQVRRPPRETGMVLEQEDASGQERRCPAREGGSPDGKGSENQPA